jgi:MerR family mercuric resistance operon transcriptional regulator
MRDHETVRGLRRGELAKRTGCNLETVRYYERIGLMPEPPRTQGGYRAYAEAHERRLRFVLRARDLGFGIDDIRGLLRLVDSQAQTCGEVREITLHHLADVRSKIADLRHLETTLARTVAACSGKRVPHCPIVDALNASTAPSRNRGPIEDVRH